ncbi:MAG: hypothetical protein U7127_25300 [Phormidium sp.]
MTGHHKFSELIKNILPERQAKIEEKTAQLKQKIALRRLLMENSPPDANQPVSLLTVADLEALLTKIVRQVIKEEMINLSTQQVRSKAAAKIDVRELSGMLYEEGRKAVSLEEMDEAISECAGESA